MKARPCLFLGRNHTIRKVFVDERFPVGARFIAPIQTQIHRKTDGATHIMTGDRIVREGIGVVAMVVMAVHIVKETPHMLTQRVIEDQEPVSLRTAHRFRLLEQILDATVIDAILEPRRFGEEAGQVGFVSALQYTAGDIGQAFGLRSWRRPLPSASVRRKST